MLAFKKSFDSDSTICVTTMIRIKAVERHTLEWGINVAPGTFGKNNKHSPLNKRSPPLK